MIKEAMDKKRASGLFDSIIKVGKSALKKEIEIPSGMFIKCSGCEKNVPAKEVEALNKVCPQCGKHFRLSASERIDLIADEGTFEEIKVQINRNNPLNFPDYDYKLDKAEKASGLKEAVVCGSCEVSGCAAVICVMDSNFMMGSMGSQVGELITSSIEYATEFSLPIVIFTCSGGARMQEGIISLMQMAKISGALGRHSEKGLLYVSVLTDPTTGGVTASFASLGDIILAEHGALVGFAGKRVIEQTLRTKLPPNFQTAEFLLEHGFVDKITMRAELKGLLSKILKLHKGASL